MIPALKAQRDRFRADSGRHLGADERVGIAVSGGPDSLALLLLATATLRGRIEAATVDHGLRPDSASEAAMVASECERLGIPHAILPVTLAEGASLQARARDARYQALGRWADERGLGAVLTAHHADDQAETLLMRLNRGAGLAGLAGVREVRLLAGSKARLVRPLLGWAKADLVEIVEAAGLTAVDDPTNRDPRHDRTAVRALLSASSGLDPRRLAASAGHLAEAEEALAFAAQRLFAERQWRDGDALVVDAEGLPAEHRRRLLLLAMAALGSEPPNGPDLARALAALSVGRACTLGGLRLEGGNEWRLSTETPRTRL